MEIAQLTLEAARAEGQRRAELAAALLARTYHMGQKPTLGKDYDDRLTVRLGVSPNTAYAYLALAETRGGIRHRRFGKKYHVTERALQEWEGDLKAQAA
jgi:hypothetical protein